ncbi:MAG: hypothetical protein ACTHJ0_12515 [Flavipsychrobacter sp.]
MKNILKLVCAILSLTVISCTKNNTTTIPKPSIALKQGNPYISKDTTVRTNTDVILGLTAAKTYHDDILRSISVSCSYNDKPDSLLFVTSLYGINGDNFQYDYNMGNQKSGKEKYTFTATTQSGTTNSVSVTISIQ